MNSFDKFLTKRYKIFKKIYRSTIKKSAVSLTIVLFVCITGPPSTFLWWLQFWPQCISTLELRFFAMPRVYRQIWWTLFAGSMEHSQVIFNEIVALFDIFFPLDQNLMTNLQWIYLFSTSNLREKIIVQHNILMTFVKILLVSFYF